MKRSAAFLLALCVLLSLGACAKKSPAQTEEKPEAPVASAPASTPVTTPTEPEKNEPERETVAVLYTNDVHCGVSAGVGFAGISVMEQALEAVGTKVILADGGDALQGEVIGTLSEGEAIIGLMNALGYDVAVPGNHDFDYGAKHFIELSGKADFPYVSANFMDEDGEAVLAPYVILERGGWKLAFVGLTTPSSRNTSSPHNFMDENGNFIFSFCQDETGEKFYAAAQNAIDSARAEGADIVIALSHLGIEAASAPWTSGDLITSTSGLDAVLDGHSHSVMERELVTDKDGREVLLASTGTKLQTVCCLTIAPDGSLKTRLINADMAETVAAAEAEIDDVAGTVVARTEVDLCITDPETELRMVRSNETNLGDLSADAYRAATGADIALVNGGNVRADVKAGDITYKDIISISPFGNELCVAEATGQEILDALEISSSNLPGERGGFLQVSGLCYTVDVDVPSGVVTDADGMFVSVNGERRVKDVTVNGEPIDPEKTYSVVSTSYMIKEGGDCINMFMDNTLLMDGGIIDNQALISYITVELGGVVGEQYGNPYGEGRITIS